MTIRLLFSVAAAALAFAISVGAEEPKATGWNVRVEVQMVSVPMAKGLALVPAMLEAQTAESAFADLDKMIVDNAARLLAWPVVWIRDRERGLSEAIEEVRYPTEFNPPQEPTLFAGGLKPDPRPWGPDIPTAFETRNIGPTLEVQPAVKSGGKLIELSIVPQMVRFVKFHEFSTPKSPLGIGGTMQQPEFLTMKATTTFTVRSGQRTLGGVFVVPEPAPHFELFIVRATAFPHHDSELSPPSP